MISIVVPAFNEEKLLGETLRHLQSARQALAPFQWRSEVIVCDNNSTDRTSEIARAAGARVVFEPLNQISRARNAGARIAQGDWLVFVDADSSPSRELFGDMAREIQRGFCVGGGSTVELEGARGWARALTGFWNHLSRRMHWMAGSFIFCTTPVFRELGGFSLELFVAEEIEFSRRLKKLARHQGRQVVILRGHPLRSSARKQQLYSPTEYLPLLWHLIRRRGGSFKDPSVCKPWYDGRR